MLLTTSARGRHYISSFYGILPWHQDGDDDDDVVNHIQGQKSYQHDDDQEDDDVVVYHPNQLIDVNIQVQKYQHGTRRQGGGWGGN